MHSPEASGSIKEIKELRRRIVKLEKVNKELAKSQSLDPKSDKTTIKWERTLDTIKDMIMVLDKEFKIVQANASLSTFTGKPIKEIIGKTCCQVIHGTESPPEGCPLKKAQSSKKHEEAELYISEQDIWIEATVDPVIDEEGLISSAIHIIRDNTNRRMAEEALRESEEQHRAIFTSAVDGFIFADKKANIIEVNPAFTEITGIPRREVVGKSAFSLARRFAKPKDIPKLLKAIHQALKGEPMELYELEINNKIVEVSTPALKAGSAGITGVIRDISDRRRAEEALRENEKRFRDIFESTLIGLYQTTPDGRILMANPTLVRMLGFKSFEELATRNIEQEGFESDYPRSQFKERIEADGQVVGMESAWTRRDGTTLFVRESARAIRDSAGNTLYYQGTIEDITERRRAEEAVARAKEEWERTFDAVSDPIMILDNQYRIVRANKAMADRLGTTPQKAVGLICYESVHGLGEPPLFCPHAMLLADGREHTAEVHEERLGGDFLASTSPLHDAKGRLIGSVHLAHDITERKRAEESLRVSECQLSEGAKLAKLGYWEHDVLNELYTFSDHFYEILRTTADKVGGYKMSCNRYFETFIYPDDRERVKAKCRDIFENPDSQSGNYLEHRIIYADGEIGHIAVRFSIVKDDQGRVIKTYGVNQDITERKHAEKEMLRADQRLRLHSEQSPLGFLEWDENFCAIEWNAACERIFGYTREEAIGRHAKDLILPAEVHELADGIYDSLMNQTGGQYSINENITKNGRIITCEWFNTTLIDRDGEAIGVASVVRDITESKQAEQERLANLHFLESMDRINRAIQGTNDLEQMTSDVLDEVLSIFDCDRASLVYPCDPEAAMWRSPMERTKPEWPGAFALGLEVPMDPEVARIFRISRAADGPVKFGPSYKEQLPTEIAAQFNIQSQMTMALYPKMGKPWNFVMHQCSYPRVWTPQEERLLQEVGRRLEDGLTSLLMYRDLKESENKYKELANSITDVFFAMDTDLKYTYWNKASENLTGIKAEDAIGKTIFEVFPDTKETRKAADVYRDVLKKRQPKSFENEYRLEDKHYFFEINAYPTGDGISVFVKDITERKRAKQERQVNIHFLESMDRINRAIQGTNDLEQMMGDVLDEVLSIFDCDRAFLLYPCDPEASSWRAQMERTRPEYPGALSMGIKAPMDPDIAKTCCLLLESDGPVKFSPESRHPLPREMSELFGYQSLISMAIYPKKGAPWVFGLHQCSYPRVWTQQEERLLQEIGRRLEDALTSLIIFQDLQESKERFRSIFDNANEIIVFVTKFGKILEVNAKVKNALGYDSDELIGKNFMTSGILSIKNAAAIIKSFKKTVDANEFPHKRDLDITEVWLNHKDGRTVLFEASTTAIRKNGKLEGFVSILRDVTESRKSQEAYRSLVDHSLQGLAIFQDGRVVFANQAMSQITDYSVEEMLALPPEKVHAFVHPEDQELVWSRHKQRLQGKLPPERYQIRGIRKDGSVRWLEIDACMVEYQGKPAIQTAYIDITKRKEAEEAMRESEEMFRSIFETSLVGVAICSNDKQWLYVNNQICKILGYSDQELRQMTWEQLTHPDDLEADVSQYNRLLAGEIENYKLEKRFIRKDSSVVYTRIYISCKRNQYGAIEYDIGLLEDITERKKAEEALKQSEAQLKRAQEVAHVGSWFLDLKADKLIWSDETYRIFGVPIGRPLKEEDFLSIVHPDDFSYVGQSWTAALHGEPYDIEHRIVVAGKVKWVHEKAELEFDAEGKPLLGIGVVQDITEYKQAERALKDSEEKYRNLFENARDVIATFDTKGNITDVNKAVEEYGFKREQLIGESLFNYIAEGHKARAVEDFEVLISGHTVSGEMDVITPKGVFTVNYSDNPIMRDKDVVGIQSILKDITERKRAEEALRTSEARLSEAMKIAKLAYWEYDVADNVFIFNDQFYWVYHSSVKQVGGYRVSPSRYAELFLHPDDAPELSKEIKRAIETTDPNFKREGEHRIIYGDGKIGYVSIRYFVVKDSEGRTVKTYGVNQDITERKKAEQAMKDSEEKYRDLFEHASDAIVTFDTKGNITGANKAVEDYGFKREQLMGKSLFDFIVEEQRAKAFDDFKMLMSGHPMHGEIDVITPKGTFTVEYSDSPILRGKDVVGAQGILTDITERKKAEDSLLEYQNKLKAMASEILMAEEHTKRRIAIGLHDDICQKLVISKFMLESSLKSLSDTNLSKSLRIISEAVGETIQRAESLTFELSNPILRDFGLVAALEKYLDEEIHQKHGISYDIRSNKQLGTLQEELKTVLFRIAKELLTNVVKHAQASNISVSIRKHNQKMCVKIQDDGIGFKVTNADSKTPEAMRFGLFSIREQLDHLGGSLSIESEPGRGTAATAVVPLDNK
jgi:PAS domain S-box-containing protein